MELEKGRCWTCAHQYAWKDDEELGDMTCDCPDIPEGEEEPEVRGCDPDKPRCPWWEQKHGPKEA